MTAEEEMDKKQLERDLFGEGEEPLSESQYRAVKCILDERDSAEAEGAMLWQALHKAAHGGCVWKDGSDLVAAEKLLASCRWEAQ